MAFERHFNHELPTKDDALFKKLYDDIKAGEVFPALRPNRFDFYHGGGKLFEFNGSSYKRNPAYDKILKEKLITEGKENFNYVTETTYKKLLGIKATGNYFCDNYTKFKLANVKRFNKEGKSDERQFLDRLYRNIYKSNKFPEVCVLDIEVRFNVNNSGKKCDLLLFNSKKCELMFVEGKMFDDDRWNEKENYKGKPENAVIVQVLKYTDLIKYCKPAIIEEQYVKYLSIMSKLIFNEEQKFNNLRLIPEAKLLVYETPKDNISSVQNLKKKVKDARVKALWVPEKKAEEYNLVKIWDELSKQP